MLKKIGAEAILTAILVPVIFWFAGFVVSSYNTMAEVSNLKSDIEEVKLTVKETNVDVKDILKTMRR
jgi:hypothetical protein